MPVPPRPPAPRPCFLPRPCVRLPRNLRVLETILALLDEHPHEERIDRPAAVAEVPSVVESALDAAKSLAGRRQTEDGPELPHIGERRLAFRDRLAQIPDRLELAVALHERVIDRLIADLPASLQEQFGEDFRIDFAPGDVVFHELEHPAERRVLRDDRAMVLAGQMQHAERVLHGRLRVALCEAPGIRDAGEAQHALRDVAHGEADSLWRGLEHNFDRAAPSHDLERERMGSAASTLPGAAAPLDLDHVELRVVDRPSDRRTNFATARTPQAGETVLVADDARDHEVHAATGVGHPLHHVDVEDLILRFREKDVHDFGLADRKPGPNRVAERRELPGEDQAAELRLRRPLAQIPLRPCGTRLPLAAAAAPPLRHQGASSFVFTASNCVGTDSPMCAPRTRSFVGSTSGLCGTETPESRRPWSAAKRRPPFEGRCSPRSRIASVTPLAEALLPARYPVK